TLPACRGIESRDEATGRVIPAANTRHDQIAVRERRCCDAVALTIVVNQCRFPQALASVCRQSHEVRIGGTDEEFVAQDSQTARCACAAQARVSRQRTNKLPELGSIAGVEGNDALEMYRIGHAAS